MLNERLLNGEMAKAGLSGTALAKKIGITPKTFYTKKKKAILLEKRPVNVWPYAEFCIILQPNLNKYTNNESKKRQTGSITHDYLKQGAG